MCLWCNTRSKAFTSLESVQRHMVDKGHCRIRHSDRAFVEYSR